MHFDGDMAFWRLRHLPDLPLDGRTISRGWEAGVKRPNCGAASAAADALDSGHASATLLRSEECHRRRSRKAVPGRRSGVKGAVLWRSSRPLTPLLRPPEWSCGTKRRVRSIASFHGWNRALKAVRFPCPPVCAQAPPRPLLPCQTERPGRAMTQSGPLLRCC